MYDWTAEVGRTPTGHEKQFGFIIRAMKNHSKIFSTGITWFNWGFLNNILAAVWRTERKAGVGWLRAQPLESGKAEFLTQLFLSIRKLYKICIYSYNGKILFLPYQSIIFWKYSHKGSLYYSQIYCILNFCMSSIIMEHFCLFEHDTILQVYYAEHLHARACVCVCFCVCKI